MSENTLLTSNLGIFGPLKELGDTSINFDTIITVKAGKYFNINCNLQIIDDATAGPKAQVKEAVAVGLSYTFRK